MLALGLLGCAASNHFPVGSYERGALFNEQGKHQEAVQALDAFIRTSPTDSLVARAQYLKALSYMKMKEYPMAAVELRILCKDYPTSEYVEEAEFLQGVADFEQVGKVQRDIGGAFEARDQFHRFLKLYPASRRAEEAREYLRRIADLVVRKRLAQARVYGHLGQHDAAVIVLGTTLEQERDSQLLDRVLLLRGEEAEKAGEPDVARESYQRLLDDYPQSKLAGEAREALERLRDADAS